MTALQSQSGFFIQQYLGFCNTVQSNTHRTDCYLPRAGNARPYDQKRKSAIEKAEGSLSRVILSEAKDLRRNETCAEKSVRRFFTSFRMTIWGNAAWRRDVGIAPYGPKGRTKYKA